MIAELKQALLDRLKHDPLLAPMLGTYDGRPSIFGFSPIPEKATWPAVTAIGASTVDPQPAKDGDLWEVFFPIRVWSDARDQNPVEVEEPADYIATALNRAALEVVGFSPFVLEASPPVVSDTQDLFGRTVGLRALIQKEG